MGMTNGQFNSYVRLVLNKLQEIKEENIRSEKLDKLIENLQAALED